MFTIKSDFHNCHEKSILFLIVCISFNGRVGNSFFMKEIFHPMKDLSER